MMTFLILPIACSKNRKKSQKNILTISLLTQGLLLSRAYLKELDYYSRPKLKIVTFSEGNFLFGLIVKVRERFFL